MLRAEFLRTMQLKFLDGEPDYDYRYACFLMEIRMLLKKLANEFLS